MSLSMAAEPVIDVDSHVIEEARLLKLHLEQNPSVCTRDALVCCCKLLEVRTA